MDDTNSIVYNNVDDNLLNINDEKISKKADKIIRKNLFNTIKKCKKGGSIVLELPTNIYSQINISSAKYLIENGFNGIYLSFQRPFKNISSLFKNNGIDTKKLVFIDIATKCSSDDSENNFNCIDVSSSFQIDKLGKEVNSKIDNLDSNNIFIMIDSLNTLSLYKKSEDIIKLSEILIKNINNNSKNIYIIFNISDDLNQNDYIKEITYNADQVIKIKKYMGKYSDEVIHPGVLT